LRYVPVKPVVRSKAAVTGLRDVSDVLGSRAVAFGRTGDPAPGDFSDAKVIRKFGDMPDDLSAL
jgi:hypothetical protein